MQSPGFIRVSLLVLASTVAGSTEGRAQTSYTEDFTTTTYRDPVNTTADWNTAAGELRMFPFSITGVGSFETAGNAVDVAVSGDLAFVADNPDVVILDITDPTNPALLGTFAAGDAQGVDPQGDLLYVANGAFGLTIVDTSDPTSPSQISTFNTPHFASDVTVEGDVAYVADGTSGLRVIEVSDPTTPVEIGSYNTPNFAIRVDVSGDWCYLADRGGSGIVVLDVSDPTTPTLAGGIVLPGDTWSVVVDGDLAYVGTAANGLVILDVSDPTTPTVLGGFDPGHVRQTAVVGDIVYAAGYGMVYALDVSDPTAPFVIESWDNPGIASAVAVAGEHAFVADGTAGGIQVLKINHVLSYPLEIGFVDTPSTAHGVAVAGDHAFVAAGNSGLRVIDISSPSSPVEIGFVDTPGTAHGVAVAGDHAFVAAGNSGLRVIDISSPSSPVEIGFVPGSLSAVAVAVAGDHAFVPDGFSKLRVIDISSPSSPVQIGFSNPVITNAQGVAVVGDHAFVVASFPPYAFRVIDISSPSSPVGIGGIGSVIDGAYGVAVAGDHAYVAHASLGLQVIDISSPSSPSDIGLVDTPNNAWDVAVSGDYAFVADRTAGLRVIDISNPSSPVEIGFADTPGTAVGVAVAGDHAFVADGSSGLRVLRVFQRDVSLAGNRGQSLPVDGTNNPIVRARLSSVQTSGVTWALSPDGGTNWQSFLADGMWTKITVPGTDLLWRSTHAWVQPGINPAVSQLDLEWRYESGFVNSIADVPDDQGGQVRVEFLRSGYDFADEATWPVTGYQIYQRVDQATAARVLTESTPVDAGDRPASWLPGLETRQRLLGDRRFVTGGGEGGGSVAGTFPPGTWEALTWVAATQSDSYTARVSTLADSSSTGIPWSVYLVTTHTTTPSVWFASEPDSGYSVDNLAPGVPESFAVAYNTGSGNALSWDAAPEPDFQFYNVYRSTDPDFVPGPGDLVHQTADPAWTDPDFDGGEVYYRVTALDFAGNESDPASPGVVTAAEAPAGAMRLALHANAPNPFVSETRIRYDVPPGGAEVEISVFDPAGRRVRTLVSGSRRGGPHHVSWDARNEQGEHVAAGMYFYRMWVGAFSREKKMLLLK